MHLVQLGGAMEDGQMMSVAYLLSFNTLFGPYKAALE